MTSIASLVLLLAACSPEAEPVASSGAAPPMAENADQQACRYGAEGMIEVARQAVNETTSRPERRESRRQLMESWIDRLASGEEPCSVYGDIMGAATTF